MNSFLDPIIILESISRAYLIKKTFEFGCSGVFRAKWTDFRPILGSLPEDSFRPIFGSVDRRWRFGLMAKWSHFEPNSGSMHAAVRGVC